MLKENHPWRNYPNKPHKQNGDARKARRPLQSFLANITNNWTTIELPAQYMGRYDRFSLFELPDYVVASWMIKMLRGYCNGNKSVEDIFEDE